MGDQKLAMCFMALAQAAGLGNVSTPKSLLGVDDLNEEDNQYLLGIGLPIFTAQLSAPQ